MDNHILGNEQLTAENNGKKFAQSKISTFNSVNQSKLSFQKNKNGMVTHHDIIQGFIVKSEKLRKEKRGEILKKKRMVRIQSIDTGNNH